MRTASRNFWERLYLADYRNYKERVVITLADEDSTQLTFTESKLWNGGIEIDEAVSSDNSLDVGSAIIGMATITIENLDGALSQYAFLKAKVVPYVGLALDDSEEPDVEYVKMGEYYVEDESFDASCVKLTCYDAMAKFDKLISASNLTYPATLAAIVSDACSVCGVTYVSSLGANGSYQVSTRPDDTSTTFRELIAWAGQIVGKNAHEHGGSALCVVSMPTSAFHD